MNRSRVGDIGDRNGLDQNEKELATPSNTGRDGKRNLGCSLRWVKPQRKRYRRLAAADRDSFFSENRSWIVRVVAGISKLYNQNSIRGQGGSASESCRAIY